MLVGTELFVDLTNIVMARDGSVCICVYIKNQNYGIGGIQEQEMFIDKS